MSIIIDILHLAIAAVLAVIGVGYERQSECPPVRFDPTAQVETVENGARTATVEDQARVMLASECDSRLRRAQFPAL